MGDAKCMKNMKYITKNKYRTIALEGGTRMKDPSFSSALLE